MKAAQVAHGSFANRKRPTALRLCASKVRISVVPPTSSVNTAEVTAILPKGAKIVSTGVAGDRVVVTLDVGGATEIRTFDAHTFKAVGRLRFANEP